MINKVVVIGSVTSINKDILHIKTWEFVSEGGELVMKDVVVKVRVIDSYTPTINELVIFKGSLTIDVPIGRIERKEKFYLKSNR